MDPLSAIESFASRAHEGQRRKFEDAPYIVHPVRVMKICGAYTNKIPILAAALLHDVLEDTAVTSDELFHFLNTVLGTEDAKVTLSLVDELTDRFIKKDYPKWNRARRKLAEDERLAACSGDSHTVKYADILDNSLSIAKSGDDFARKYLLEAKTLLTSINKGDPALYKKVTETISALITQEN